MSGDVMSLIMYRNGVLSADRRINQINMFSSHVTGTEYDSKLYVNADKTFAAATVGSIPNQEKYRLLEEAIKKHFKEPTWKMDLLQEISKNNLMDRDTCIFTFFNGRFTILKRENEDHLLEEIENHHDRVCGSGYASAYVLIRSKLKISNKDFYRIVASSANSVGTVFDEIDIKTIKGFES